jgi:hypothetical protein
MKARRQHFRTDNALNAFRGANPVQLVINEPVPLRKGSDGLGIRQARRATFNWQRPHPCISTPKSAQVSVMRSAHCFPQLHATSKGSGARTLSTPDTSQTCFLQRNGVGPKTLGANVP